MTKTASFGSKLLSTLLSLVLVAGLLPVLSPAKAYAEGEDSQPAYLSDLRVRLDRGTQNLVASFDPATREYTVTVPASETQFEMGATLSEAAPEGSTAMAYYFSDFFQFDWDAPVTLEDGSYSTLSVSLLADETPQTVEVRVGKGSDTQSYTVNVERCATPEMSLSAPESPLAPGEAARLAASYSEGYPNAGETWYTSDASVATVDESGLVTAVAPGTATITALHTNHIQAECTVTVADPSPVLSLSTEATDLKVGQEFALSVSMANISAAAQAKLTCSENLQLVKIEAGSALTGEDVSFENVAGNGLFSFCANEGEDDGVVAVATFKCVAAGEATVGLTAGLAGKTLESSEFQIADPEGLTLAIGLAGIMGDVNNNAKINIVDAQIAYDMACGKYAAGSDAAAALLACWGAGATLPMVEAIADVNGEGLDGTDAFAIQYYVHYGKFGE